MLSEEDLHERRQAARLPRRHVDGEAVSRVTPARHHEDLDQVCLPVTSVEELH